MKSLNAKNLEILQRCSKQIASMLKENHIVISSNEVLDDILNMVLSKANGGKSTVTAATAPTTLPQHNPAADILCLAFAHFQEGELETSLKYVSAAFEAEGIEELVQAMESMNNEVEEASFNKDADSLAQLNPFNGNMSLVDLDIDDMVDEADLDYQSTNVPVDHSQTDEINTDYLDDEDEDEDEDDDDPSVTIEVKSSDLGVVTSQDDDNELQDENEDEEPRDDNMDFDDEEDNLNSDDDFEDEDEVKANIILANNMSLYGDTISRNKASRLLNKRG